MTLNREQAIKIINLLDEVKAELTHILEGFTTKKVEKTVNQQRAEIIEKAKEFVGDIVNVGKSKYGPKINEGNVYYKSHHFDVDFYLKNNKITALVFLCNGTGKRLDHKPVLIKRALCSPNEVFNTNIGKAIALGRAFDLDVSEFENAAQPTVAVGQITKILDPFGKETNEICKVVSLNEYAYPIYIDGMHASYYKIINDTNAIYNDSKEGK